MGKLALTGNSRTRKRLVDVVAAPANPILALGAGLFIWYDPTTGVTDAGGGAVSQWNDQSGNGRNATQATGGLRPVTGTRTKNGLNVIDFTGSSHISASSGISFNLTTFTVIALLESDADHSDSRRAVAANVGLASDYNRNDSTVFLHDGNASEKIGTDCNGTFPRIAGAGAAPWDVYSVRKANAASSNNLELKAHVAAGSTTATVSANGTASIIALGCDQSGATRWDGVMGDIVICSASITDQQRTDIVTYLRAKWGI